MWTWKIGSSEAINISDGEAQRIIGAYGNNMEIVATKCVIIYCPTNTVLPQELIYIRSEKKEQENV